MVLSNDGAWKQSENICNYVNNLSEEMISPEELQKDSNAVIVALGKVLEIYQEILSENNLMDFSSIQTETYRLFMEHKEVLKEMHKKLAYIMVDEYQDTNYIQEQLVFLLAGERKNICVVGDDD